MIPLVMALTLMAAEGDGAAAGREPFNVSCRPVLGERLRPGAWSLVALDADNRFKLPLRPGLGQEVRGSWHGVLELPALGPGERRGYLVPFRPLPGANPPEAVLEGRGRRGIPDLVGADDARVVAVIGRLALPATAPAAFAGSRTDPAELPGYPAAYEGLDVLVIGELDGARPGALQRAALKTWFLGGGKVFVVSAAAREALADVLFKAGPAGTGTGRWDDWKKAHGAADDDVAAWTGEDGKREPLVVRFRTGFGRGAFLWPAEWRHEESAAAWSAYQRLLESSRSRPLVPAVDRAIYEDFPALEAGLFGSDAALRWALGVALLISSAGAILWRRGHPWRLCAAAGVAALAAAALTGSLARSPEGRTLSVRIDEFSSDGAGARARELLYLERVAPGWRAEVQAGQDVLPSAVLANWEDGGEFASRLDLPAPGAVDGPRLSELDPGAGGLLVGAGPLPGTVPMASRPEGARALAGLKADACVAAIADCLSPRNGRCRPQAEKLAGWLWRDLESRGMLGPSVAVYVCRLPDEAQALAPAGRVQSERLGRLGVFYSDGG
jgi:hypothetical protein